MLDSQEYLHLAIKSSQEGQHQAALQQLYQCLEKDPENATALFLLAAEHAELGMTERAIGGMQKALKLNPSLEIAQLQLGILYAKEGNNNQAMQLWNDLSQKSDEDSLRLFANGLSYICAGEHKTGIEKIKEGMAANNYNVGLNSAMKNIIDNIQPEKRDIPNESTQDGRYLGAYSKIAIGNDK